MSETSKEELDGLLKKANQLMPNAHFSISRTGEHTCPGCQETKTAVFSLFTPLSPRFIAFGTREEIAVFLEGVIFALENSKPNELKIDPVVDAMQKLGFEPLNGLVKSRWICAKQENKQHCRYNAAKDPHHDQCVYCGEPEERP